ncbi:hypothetical protein X947_4312 [Burkholderia pseudomallei MSHR7334]|nr:hypothetical protein DP56_5919 [Burkholderia pseudomallei]KGS20658.1 hypothetical protein X941_5768 [Burkholderia pseudomallei MSHR5569]KGS79781.1 hypothetical protein X947_4312 [Burkholderia pseudomallei MSHR7334]
MQHVRLLRDALRREVRRAGQHTRGPRLVARDDELVVHDSRLVARRERRDARQSLDCRLVRRRQRRLARAALRLVRIVDDRERVGAVRAAERVERGNRPQRIGQVIDGRYRAPRVGAEHQPEGFLQIVREPRAQPQRRIGRRRAAVREMQRANLLRERLRAHHRAVEPRADAVLDMRGQRDRADARLGLEHLQRRGSADDRIDVVAKRSAAIGRIDPRVPPHEFLDRRLIGRRIALRVGRGAVEGQPVRQPARRGAGLAVRRPEARRALDREAEKIVAPLRVGPVEGQQDQRRGKIAAHADGHRRPPRLIA